MTSRPTRDAPPDELSQDLDPRRWRALLACVSALFMTLLDVSIVNVALPSIGTTTGARPSELQWVVSGYVLAFGMVPIIAGRLGDDRGRRRMLQVGILGFVASSLVVGLAPTAGLLIAGRAVQGLAGGLINPQVSGLVQQLFPRSERGRAFGMIGIAVGTATAAGPVVGGAIIGLVGTTYGWRVTFLVNAPVGLLAVLLVRRLVAPDCAPAVSGRHRPLDVPGAALLALGVFGVLLPVVEYDTSRDPRLALLLVPALAVLGCFAWWERGPARRGGHPLIDVRLFRIRSYADGVLLALLYFIAYSGTPLVLSLFLQDGLGYTPLQAGLSATSFAVGAALSAPIGGRLVSRVGRRLLVASIGLFVLGIGCTALAVLLSAGRVPPERMGYVLALPLLIAGFGGGSVITPNQALSLAEVDVRGGSTAGGMLQTAQRLGTAAGTAMLSAVLYTAAAPVAASPAGISRAEGYAHAYVLSLALAVVVAVAALALAVRDVWSMPSPAVPAR